MPENITHVAVVDDCIRVASRWPEICPALKDALTQHLEIARLGGLTRISPYLRLLEKLRDSWTNRRPEDNLEMKLAFTVGTILHQAADIQMKPVYHSFGGREPYLECSIYTDVHLLGQIYGAGKDDAHWPYSPALLDLSAETLPAIQGFSAKDLEDLSRVLLMRAYIALHTFQPGLDILDWMDRFFLLRQNYFISVQQYAEVFTNPNPEKVKRYVVDTNFYNPEDPLIQLARTIQAGNAVDGGRIEEARSRAESQSQYARAVARGCKYVRASSLFFENEMSRAEAIRALELPLKGSQAEPVEARTWMNDWETCLRIGK